MASWDTYEFLVEMLGTNTLCDAMARAMDTDTMDDILSFIMKEYDLEPEGQEN